LRTFFSVGPFEGTPRKFRIYYWSIVAVGTLLAVRFFPTARIESWAAVLWWLGFYIAAEMMPILLPGSRAYITVTSALEYAAIVIFGPVIAAILSTVSTIVTAMFTGVHSPHKLLFNVCLFIITVLTAGRVFQLLGGTAGADIGQLILPLTACGITYFAMDTFGVSFILGFLENKSAWRVWQRTYLWTTVTHIVGFVPLGAIIAVIYKYISISGVALFLIPLLLARYSFKLYAEMHTAHLDTIRALTSTIDSTDPFTAGHSERVTQYAIAIARELGLSENRVMTIEYAGLLHDMGKVAVRNEILLKHGKLSDSEWEAMKSHPTTGAKIVADVKFLERAKEIVLHHHERFDGKGYPEGVGGADLSLEARIVKVADSFDAMMSNRPYRKSLGLTVAVGELAKGKGSEFDPVVVDAFLALIWEDRIEIPRHDVEFTDAELASLEEAEAVEVK
jgi:putative nucleotidyltransferase with HDIG domain